MLDDVGLIHMNARLYDPVLGRMLSADSIAPEPGHTQGLNRYAYVYNNPFGYTDPSGHAPSKLMQILGSVLNIVISTVLTPIVGPQIAGAIGGYVGGWVSSGGDSAAARQGAINGFVAGVFRGLANGISGEIGFAEGSLGDVTVHALASGSASAALGGDFETGFVSGGFSRWANTEIDAVGGDGVSVERIMLDAAAGAIGARINGDDPLTGAMTAGFGQLFGDLPSNRDEAAPNTGALTSEDESNLNYEALIGIDKVVKIAVGKHGFKVDEQFSGTFSVDSRGNGYAKVGETEFSFNLADMAATGVTQGKKFGRYTTAKFQVSGGKFKLSAEVYGNKVTRFLGMIGMRVGAKISYTNSISNLAAVISRSTVGSSLYGYGSGRNTSNRVCATQGLEGLCNSL